MVLLSWSTKGEPGPLDQECDLCDGSILICWQMLGKHEIIWPVILCNLMANVV